MYEIDLSGVIETKREVARKEFDEYLSSWMQKIGDANVRVVVAIDFTETVESYRNEIFKKLRKYNPQHLETIAQAKTVPFVVDDKLWFAIILDGKTFGSWDDQLSIYRMVVLLHELAHVVDFNTEAKIFGRDFLFEGTRTAEQLFFKIACDIWTEYHAERRALGLINDAAKSIDPSGYVTYNVVEDFADRLVKMLKEIEPFVRDLINKGTTGEIDINYFFLQVSERMKEMLNIASFLYAQAHALEKHRNLINKIESLPEFQRFLGDTWKKVVGIVMEMFDSEIGYNVDKLRIIASEVRNIFAQCGVEVKDTEQGVHVRALWA